MKLHGNAEIISLYMDGRLDEKLRASLESHLKDCGECREILARMQETRTLIAGAAPVKPPATLERDIIAGLPERKTFSLFFRRIYLPAIGTLAVMVIASLLIREYLPREIELQIAKTPVREQDIADKDINESGRKKIETQTDFHVAEKSKESPVHSESSGPPQAPEGKTVPADRPIAEIGREEKCIMPAEEKREAEKTMIARESAAGKPAAVMKASKDEAISLAYRKTAFSPIVIRSEDEWKKIWHTQNTMQNLSLPLPEVDFREKMVVAVPSRIEDREYLVVNTVEKADKIVVEYRELPLQQPAPAPYQMNVVNRKPAVELQKID